MSTTTDNLGLIKLELSDPADITKLNENFDKLDNALSSLSPDYVIEQNNNNEQRFWIGTKAEYNAIQTKDPNTTYTVTDDEDTDNFQSIALRIYPVGSIYMSAVKVSPGSIFGGVWEQLKDRFLLAAGSTYSAGSTGGAATVTLTESQIPKHRHKTNSAAFMNASHDPNASLVMRSATLESSYDEVSYTDYTGDGKAHNNMPPYLTVYMWKRTA